jgi:hypothetical protein
MKNVSKNSEKILVQVSLYSEYVPLISKKIEAFVTLKKFLKKHILFPGGSKKGSRRLKFLRGTLLVRVNKWYKFERNP